MKHLFFISIFSTIYFFISCNNKNEANNLKEKIVVDSLYSIDSIYNNFDKFGRKIGLWVDTNANIIIYSYYKSDTLDGPQLIYHYNGKLFKYGNYEKGKLSKCMYFNENGTIWFEEREISEYKNGFKSYIINYYFNGYIESEGYVSYYDSPIVDYDELGKWRYFDTSGNLVKEFFFTN